jgi:DNA polymerase-1
MADNPCVIAAGERVVAAEESGFCSFRNSRHVRTAPRSGRKRRLRQKVRARYGVDPEQVPDFIALRGDPSDKLPGAPGVGAIGAATLLRRYGTLDKALAAGRFPAHAKQLRLFRSIATMNRKAPLPALRDQKPSWASAAALAKKWQFTQLAKRVSDTTAATIRSCAATPPRRPSS